MKRILFFFVLCANATFAQDAFTIHLVPSAITAAPAIHSGSFAERNGKWIFIGGRMDGMHHLQANQAFPEAFRNDSIFVVDPVSNTYKSATAKSLPGFMYEALCSSNMQYHQDGNYLYMIGGYGLEDSAYIWITFPTLISIDLDCLSSNINSGTSITGCFRMITDSNFAVTGGGLCKIDSTYFLACGHRFEGRYSKPATSLFIQQYTHDIRKFSIHDDGINLSISNYVVEKDTDNYHRRDFNLVPQVFPDGSKGATLFGGVFQKNADQPFLTPIDIKATSITHQSTFNENLNQYTTATLPLHDLLHNTMHTVFFGGLSLYTLDTVTLNLVQDTLVPFVSTISRVTRDSLGGLTEIKMQENMPALKGTNAYFIPDTSLMQNGVMNLNAIIGNMKVGYLMGGIESDQPNVADLDPFGMSRANSQVYEVYVDKTITGVKELEITNAVNNLIAYPNPVENILHINFSLNKEEYCEIKLFNSESKLIRTYLPGKNLNGEQHFVFDTNGIKSGIYSCQVRAGKSVKVLKIVIER